MLGREPTSSSLTGRRTKLALSRYTRKTRGLLELALFVSYNIIEFALKHPAVDPVKSRLPISQRREKTRCHFSGAFILINGEPYTW